MRILITAIDGSQEPCRVEVSSEIGDFSALWRSDPPPQLGQDFVEIDCHEDLQWTVDIRRDPGAAPRIVGDSRGATITGVVEEVALDEPVRLKVGPANIALDVEGDPPLGIVDTTVTVTVTTLAVSSEHL